MANRTVGKRLAVYRRRTLGLSAEKAAWRWGMPVRTLEAIESRGVADSHAGIIADLLNAIEGSEPLAAEAGGDAA